MKNCLLVLTIILFLGSCKSDSAAATEKNDPLLEKIGGKNYRDIIRIPVDDSGTIDTTQLAKIQFDQTTYDFGDVVQGKKKTLQIPFRSVGNNDLYILSGESSCGCTVANYPKAAIAPGDEEAIEVTFDADLRPIGPSTKFVLLKTNTYPNTHKLKFTVNVIE